MGSTPYGNADPVSSIGMALPQHIEICRDSGGRVWIDGRT
jgi:hypothetical protein